ncbi:spermatogenesis-associated protein 1 isoform X5 [Equus quagga]|uniref:spermatogenesis-associated protein 1 isoform X5 n=1 Tax=Equus quagga TaxID=89248 RepID=UPI001EE1E602|nr:spermatogenesis-associated protein 1 isoform X5 [Equus quagga]
MRGARAAPPSARMRVLLGPRCQPLAAEREQGARRGGADGGRGSGGTRARPDAQPPSLPPSPGGQLGRGSWNYKLNTISIEVANEFISAGFIRVSPHLTLQALRERLGEFLGEDAVAEKFLFLKCIGNNLAVVKTKQESELKLKSFAPPYALQPELYLLPIMDHLGNTYSVSTVSVEGLQTNNGVAEADEIIHKPVSVTLSKEEPGTDPSFLENTLKELLNKNPEEAWGKATPKESQTGKNQTGNSELPGSLEDSDNDYFSSRESQLFQKNEDDRGNIIRREDNQIGKKECVTLPDLIDFPSLPALSPGITISLLQIEREKIIEQMKQVKEERRYLERIREELVKKVEKLFEQSRLKRYQASDGWKKKYFETKKVTASLEEVLTKLREDLELYYKKLLMQLEAREIKMRPKNLANITDSKFLEMCLVRSSTDDFACDELAKSKEKSLQLKWEMD